MRTSISMAVLAWSLGLLSPAPAGDVVHAFEVVIDGDP